MVAFDRRVLRAMKGAARVQRSLACFALIGMLALTGCGGGGADTESSVAVVSAGGASPVPVPTPAPAPAPTPTPTPAGTATLSPTLAGLDPVASGLDVASYLQPSWGSGNVAATGVPDVVGAFRFVCTPSHNAYDDPIVFPGQPGRSHLHTFFGNTTADANSTYASLRSRGDSTCNNMLNRSAYWMPAMMTPAGKVVMPNFITIYYKRLPETSPECKRQGIACVALPRGLRYIFGYNMSNPSGAGGQFSCEGTSSSPFKTIPEAAKGCPVGAKLSARLDSPSCWDGKNLDSADHRSHMAYPDYGSWGYLKCPGTHPYVVPTFTLAAFYVTDESLDRSGNMSADANTWYLASDRMAGMAWQTPGMTLHADWFGAWEDSIMKLWTDHCINLLLSCTGGDLGNGQQLKMLSGYNWPATTQLANAPAKPS